MADTKKAVGALEAALGAAGLADMMVDNRPAILGDQKEIKFDVVLDKSGKPKESGEKYFDGQRLVNRGLFFKKGNYDLPEAGMTEAITALGAAIRKNSPQFVKDKLMVDLDGGGVTDAEIGAMALAASFDQQKVNPADGTIYVRSNFTNQLDATDLASLDNADTAKLVKEIARQIVGDNGLSKQGLDTTADDAGTQLAELAKGMRDCRGTRC